MRKLFIYLSLIAFGLNPLLADEVPKKTTEIEVLISEIKNAKPSDKRVLMNKLKVKLRASNKESRKKVMMDLRKSFNKKGSPRQIQKNVPVHRDKTNPRERKHQQLKSRPIRDGQKRGQ